MNHSTNISPVRLESLTSGTSQLQRLSDLHHSLSSPAIVSMGSPSSPTPPVSEKMARTPPSVKSPGHKTLSKAFLEEAQEVDKKKKTRTSYKPKKTAAVKDFVLSNLGRVLSLQRNNSGSSFGSLTGGGLFNRSYQSGCGVSSLGSSCKDLLDMDTDTEDELCNSGRFPLHHEQEQDHQDYAEEDSEIDSLRDPLQHEEEEPRPTSKPPRPATSSSRRIPITATAPKPILIGSRNSSMPDLVAIQFDSMQSLPNYETDDEQEQQPGLSTSYPPSYHPKWIPAAHQKKTKKDRWTNSDGQSDFIPFSPRRYSCGDATKFTKATAACFVGANGRSGLPSIPRFDLTETTSSGTGTKATATIASPTATASTSTNSTTSSTMSGLAGLQLSPLDTAPVAPRRASDSVVHCQLKKNTTFPRRGSLSDTLPTLPRRPLDD